MLLRHNNNSPLILLRWSTHRLQYRRLPMDLQGRTAWQNDSSDQAVRYLHGKWWELAHRSSFWTVLPACGVGVRKAINCGTDFCGGLRRDFYGGAVVLLWCKSFVSSFSARTFCTVIENSGISAAILRNDHAMTGECLLKLFETCFYLYCLWNSCNLEKLNNWLSSCVFRYVGLLFVLQGISRKCPLFKCRQCDA